ncbi:MAG: tRNA(Ile)-lysidine synthase [Arcticibacterium sp.]|jgi:tRNA(Ile)-lysidine synthase
MCMLHLFQKSGHDLFVAHCNFSLRAEASVEDEAMINQYCKSKNIPFESIRFDTLKEAKRVGVSTQMIARNLRYDWFSRLKLKHKIDFIATGHHAGDSLETALLNLTRGTGINGLKGILPLHHGILRPLLFAQKEGILAYVKQEKIPFREDSSNVSVKYHRNFIRHKVVPLLEEINPSLKEGFLQTSERVAKALFFINTKVEFFKKKYIRSENGLLTIFKIDFFDLENRLLIEFWLDQLAFNYGTVKAIFKEEIRLSGKQFISATHQLTFDREEILVKPFTSANQVEVTISLKQSVVETKIGTLKLEEVVDFPTNDSLKSPDKAYLDFSKLKFPLKLRNWQNGDRFRPFGMKQTKLISDFLIDKKVPLPVKDKTLVLCSAGEVVWLLGHRISDDYKVDKNTPTLLKLTFTDL